ncbi:MAG: RsmG family class I SAM-dependent methyltransferase, partial [Erythrobacter sp.]|nr:RsmG family class I SAM-dependent methyltransferase [Erythrobacter sp.]
AQLLEHVPRGTFLPGPWLDLGTGAGFPGIVIAALRPEWEVVLVESRARRAEFLETCVRAFDLPRCRVIGERLERVEPFAAGVISARAFAPLDKLLRLSAPFSTKATRYVLPKGRSAAHELSQAKKPIRAMFHVEHSLTDREAGIIVSA